MSSEAPVPPQPGGWRGFWNRLSWKGKVAIIGGAVLLLLLVIGLAFPAPDDEDDTAASANETATTETTEEATTEETTTQDEPTNDGDTGRMSEGEFDTFERHDQELISEAQQWSSEYATCATIGQTGDFVGFRDCMDEAWDGFEDAALLAYSNADDTLDDVGLECLDSLRTYKQIVDRLYSQSLAAYETAKALNFDLMPAAFKPLPKVARQYAKVSIGTRAACSPT